MSIQLSPTYPSFPSASYSCVAGHGTCWDFNDAALTKLIEEMHAANKVVAAVCHGPTALVPAKKPDGSPLVEGKTVTGFTDEEEKQVQKETVRLAEFRGSSAGDELHTLKIDAGRIPPPQIVPYMLESKLRELKANYKGSDAWSDHAGAQHVLVVVRTLLFLSALTVFGVLIVLHALPLFPAPASTQWPMASL